MRFSDENGVDLGQGLVPLDQAWAAPQRLSASESGSGEQIITIPDQEQGGAVEEIESARCSSSYEIELTRGGVRRGVARFSMRISYCV